MIYWQLVKASIQSRMDYRGGFFAFLFSLVLFYAAQFGVVVAIVYRFDRIGDWQKGEVAFLYALLILAQGINSCLFSGLIEFDDMVRMGEFDRVLVRPTNPLFNVLSSKFDPSALAHLAMGVLALVLAERYSGVQWNAWKLLSLPPVILGGALIFAAVRLVIAAIAFFSVQNKALVHLFVFSSKEFLLYPINIYSSFVRVLLTFIIPLAFINYYPSIFFLDKNDPSLFHPVLPYLTVLVGIALFGLASLFWRRSLDHYQSAGS